MNGDIAADAPGIAVFTRGNDYGIKRSIEFLGTDSMKPGDVFINNYPYWSSAHTLDPLVFAPIHVDGRLVGFASSGATCSTSNRRTRDTYSTPPTCTRRGSSSRSSGCTGKARSTRTYSTSCASTAGCPATQSGTYRPRCRLLSPGSGEPVKSPTSSGPKPSPQPWTPSTSTASAWRWRPCGECPKARGVPRTTWTTTGWTSTDP